MLNPYGEKPNQSKIFGSGTRNVINLIVAFLGLSIQGLVSHIINIICNYTPGRGKIVPQNVINVININNVNK